MDDTTLGIIILVGAVAVYLATHKWFWVIAFGVGCLASVFAMIASVIHFQILWALGFAVLAAACAIAFAFIKDTY